METSDILKRVRQIEIKTRGLSNNIFAGEYHSAFKGRGMAFSEVREYQYQLAIYVYEKGLGSGGNYSMSTAVNLFQSLVGLILVLLADRFAKAIGEDGLL